MKLFILEHVREEDFQSFLCYCANVDVSVNNDLIHLSEIKEYNVFTDTLLNLLKKNYLIDFTAFADVIDRENQKLINKLNNEMGNEEEFEIFEENSEDVRNGYQNGEYESNELEYKSISKNNEFLNEIKTVKNNIYKCSKNKKLDIIDDEAKTKIKKMKEYRKEDTENIVDDIANAKLEFNRLLKKHIKTFLDKNNQNDYNCSVSNYNELTIEEKDITEFNKYVFDLRGRLIKKKQDESWEICFVGN